MQLMTKLDWFGTLFPRIPVPVEKKIHEKLQEWRRTRAAEAAQEVANAVAQSTSTASANASRTAETAIGSVGGASRAPVAAENTRDSPTMYAPASNILALSESATSNCNPTANYQLFIHAYAFLLNYSLPCLHIELFPALPPY